MKKSLLSFLSLFSAVALYAEEEIPLASSSGLSQDHRNDLPVFHAETEDDATITIYSDRVTSFDVTVLSQSSDEVQYQGSTEQGVLHLTNAIPTGAYIIEISHNGETLKGQFEIE